MPCPVYDEKLDPIGKYTDVKQFFFSNEMTQLRTDLNNNIIRPGCAQCLSAEDARVPGSFSTRQWANDRYYANPDQPVGITTMEISAGRTCTLKCRMCAPHSSTAWAAEHRSRGLVDASPSLDWTAIPIDLLANLTHLKITGGEPFLSPNLSVMLKELHQAGLSQQIDAEIYTNAEEFPDTKFTDYMQGFKSFRVYFSIDGVGKRNEYIRSGSSWPRTIDTILRWGKWKTRFGLDNIQYSISYTYTTFNCLYNVEIVDWVKSMRSNPGLEDLNLEGWHFARDDSWHAVMRLPYDIRQELITMLSNKRSEFGPLNVWAEKSTPDQKKAIGFTRARLLHHPLALPSSSFDEWWQEIRTLDMLRGQDIYQALPEIVDLFTRHGLLTAQV